MLALVGHAAWGLAMVAAIFELGYGPITIATQAIALAGCLLVGLVLIRTEDVSIGAAIVVASAIMLFGWPMAWLVYGLAWTTIGVLLLARPEPAFPSSTRFA